MSFATRAACASMFALAPLAAIAGTMPDPIFQDTFEGDCANGTETPAALQDRWSSAITQSLDAQCIPPGSFGDAVNGGDYCTGDQGACTGGCDVSFIADAATRDWTTTFDLDLAWHGGVTIPVSYRLFGMPNTCTLVVTFTNGIVGHQFSYTPLPPSTASALAFAQADDENATVALAGCSTLVALAGAQVQQVIADALAALSLSAQQSGGAALAGRSACPAPLTSPR